MIWALFRSAITCAFWVWRFFLPLWCCFWLFLDAQLAARWHLPALPRTPCHCFGAPFARQTNFFRAYQSIVHLADGAANRCFTDTIGLGNMKFRSIFSPVHQGHQQLIGSVKFRGSSEVSQPFFNDCKHLIEGFALDARQSFEVTPF
jgi:hypothetical protein